MMALQKNPLESSWLVPTWLRLASSCLAVANNCPCKTTPLHVHKTGTLSCASHVAIKDTKKWMLHWDLPWQAGG